MKCGFTFSSVVERLPSKRKALGSVLSSEKKKKKKRKREKKEIWFYLHSVVQRNFI